MGPERYGRLNEAQRDTLRLYHAHLQIKEIAERLDISVSTVNQRLTQCRRLLGASSSKVAALWLAQYEQEAGICSQTAYRFSTMASPPLAPSTEGVAAMGTDLEPDNDNPDSKGPAMPEPAWPSKRRFPWPFATASVPDNRLNGWTRLALVLPVAAFLLIAAMILVLLGIGLQEVLVGLQHLVISDA